MSEKFFAELETGLSTGSVRTLSNEAFLKVQELQRVPFKHYEDQRYAQQLLVLGAALEYIVLADTKQEQVEFVRVVSKYDPIMWDLLFKHSSTSPCSSSDLLREFITTLQDYRKEIEGEYDSIIRPYRWGGSLASEHLQYKDFVSGAYARDGLILTALVLLMASAATLGVLLARV